MITSNFFAISAGMIPAHAVGTNSTSTPMSSATLVATSISKPTSSPFLLRIAQGTKVDIPTRSVPRFFTCSTTLSLLSVCCTFCACALAPTSADSISARSARPSTLFTFMFFRLLFDIDKCNYLRTRIRCSNQLTQRDSVTVIAR